MEQEKRDLLVKLHKWLDKRCTVSFRKNTFYIGFRGTLSKEESYRKALGVLRCLECD